MNSIYKFLVFLAMIYLHVADDFNQGILADLKQKKTWDIPDKELGRKNIYRNDYIPPLMMHSIKWSIVIHIPVIIYLLTNEKMRYLIETTFVVGGIDTSYVFIFNMLISIFGHAVIHGIVDHFKCNRFKINLIVDQLFHVIQIVFIFILNVLLNK